MQSAQDQDVWLRLMRKYHAAYVNEVLVRYYIHAGDKITKSYQRQVAGWERINLKNADYLQQHPEALRHRKLRMIHMYARAGQSKKAVQAWWFAVKVKPGKVKQNVFYFLVMVKNIIFK